MEPGYKYKTKINKTMNEIWEFSLKTAKKPEKSLSARPPGGVRHGDKNIRAGY